MKFIQTKRFIEIGFQNNDEFHEFSGVNYFFRKQVILKKKFAWSAKQTGEKKHECFLKLYMDLALCNLFLFSSCKALKWKY